MKTDNVKSEIVWKGFRLGNLFEWSGKHRISKTAKEYSVSNMYQEGYVANITAGQYNEGIANFIPEDDEITNKKKIDALTISSNGAGVGSCFFHDYYFISTGDNALLENKYDKLQEIFDRDHMIPRFFAKLITKICRNSLYSWSYKVSKELFNRELIVLPCLEVSQDDEYIWEENGRYYTLAVEYIKELMEKAKERKEARTIRMYEAERAKYEAERAKYEAGYNAEKPNVLWKGFRLGNLFERSTKLAIQKNQKELNLSSEKNTTHTVALISASRNDSGCAGYIQDDIIDDKKISINKITFDDQWGFTFFQREKFVITGGHNAILEVKNYKLKKILDGNLLLYSFLSSIINKITFKSGLFGYGYKINNKFDREIILLPCLEVSQDDEYIWGENGRYYTLATNYISYLYLTGRINKYQKLIDTYTYMY